MAWSINTFVINSSHNLVVSSKCIKQHARRKITVIYELVYRWRLHLFVRIVIVSMSINQQRLFYTTLLLQ